MDFHSATCLFASLKFPKIVRVAGFRQSYGPIGSDLPAEVLIDSNTHHWSALALSIGCTSR